MQWASLNPGEMREQIVWQRKVVTGQDGFGQDLYDWTDLLSCYAKVESLSGIELQREQQRWAEAQYRVRHQFTKGMRPKDRIAWNNDGTTQYLDVLDVSDREGLRMITTVVAKEWVS